MGVFRLAGLTNGLSRRNRERNRRQLAQAVEPLVQSSLPGLREPPPVGIERHNLLVAPDVDRPPIAPVFGNGRLDRLA